MLLKFKAIFILLNVFLGFVSCNLIAASTLNSISIQNNFNQSTIIIKCNVIPLYKIFSLHDPERIVIDLKKISKLFNRDLFPIKFSGNNLVTCVRASFSIPCQSIRIVCDLYHASDIVTITQKKIEQDYCIVLTISKKTVILPIKNTYYLQSAANSNHKQFINFQRKIVSCQCNNLQNSTNDRYKKICTPIVVAIDAGHGGQDPGATGYRGMYEKNITFSIAKRLKKLLDVDPIFKAVMIRNGDYFLSVTERSDLARKNKANLLISIHVDSSLNNRVRGASVWVLSNRRAKSETVHWLHRKDKYAELLGGLGDVLTNYKNNPYFDNLVLDLQFVYTQREGHNMATHILNQLKNISFLHKNTPEYSNFGILRSPDIPSVLVEIGFISNLKEEHLLATNKYQERIAYALYKGLSMYVKKCQEKL